MYIGVQLCSIARLAALAAIGLLPTSAMAISGGQGDFLAELWSEAKAHNIPRDLFDEAFVDFELNPRIVEFANTQPEALSTSQDYVERRVNSARIKAGRLELIERTESLARIEEKYGVSSEILIAIWGIETNYGGFLGRDNVLHSLATLVHEGYRKEYLRDELITALEIVRDGYVGLDQMKGSWAGAMGQTQFMPSSVLKYAVDFDGNGRVDIWSSVPDSLASSANYLRENGWKPGEPWGYEVNLPEKFNYAAAWNAEGFSLREWMRMGIVRVDGKAFEHVDESARFYLPAGRNGPAFLLLSNFDAIKRYNNSDNYALSVAHLADRLRDDRPFATQWPKTLPSLTLLERREIQTLLAERGFYSGEIDGLFGTRTRLAVVGFQEQHAMEADSIPTRQILQMLRTGNQRARLME